VTLDVWRLVGTVGEIVSGENVIAEAAEDNAEILPAPSNALTA